MDFDDLDDAIDARLAEGDMTGLEGLTFEKKDLKTFTGTLPYMPTSGSLYTCKGAEKEGREITTRAFIFPDAVDKAQDMNTWFMKFAHYNPEFELAVYQWPGSGSRESEPMPEDLDALAADAFEALKPALDQVKEDAEYEGAKFAFIGKGVGCQLLTLVAKKTLITYGMAPYATVVLGRGAPQFPLLSEKGQELLEDNPDKVVEAYSFQDNKKVDKEKFATNLKYACDTRDQFYHKFECPLLCLKGKEDAAFDEKGKVKSKYKMITLRIKESDEEFKLPVENATTVKGALKCVAQMFAYSRDDALTAYSVDGSEIKETKQCENVMIIEGLVDFQHPRYTWPHPVCFIGTGFWSVRAAIQWHINENRNLIMFDRHPQIGGDAWHLSATKYSRCQTDFGMFNVWWGHEMSYTGDGGFGTEKGGRAVFTQPFLGPGSPMNGTVASGAGSGVDYHPVRLQILDSIRYASREYGLDKCAESLTEVTGLKIVGDANDEKRFYDLEIKSLKEPPEPNKNVKVSVIYHFPGAYDVNRIIDYPGEDEFGGQIGYGMGNGQGGEFKWTEENMKGKKCAILGNGAFSVENVRSCAETGAAKVYIVTRRKSLLCPRLPCWFCHQAPDPIPAGFLLDIFKPIYDCAGIEDPWSFYAVIASANRKDVTLKQSSRFGIGDVTFLLHAYGLFEYRLDTLARCSHRKLHLTSGEVLEDMDHLCKALGLLGDPRVDKLHAMTHKLGAMINGDWRRVMTADPTGMDAKRFTTFSAGPGAAAFAKQWYYIFQRPWEMVAAQKNPDWDILFPVHKMSNTQPDQTVYMTNIQYEMFAGTVFFNLLPSQGYAVGDEASYKYCLINTMHPVDKMLEYAKADWDRYQNLIRDYYSCNGFDKKPWVPYPYTMDMVRSWFDDYKEKYKLQGDIVPEGPTEAFKEQVLEDYKTLNYNNQMSLIPGLLKEYRLLPSAKESEDPMAEAMASAVYEKKKDLSISGGSMDYSAEHYDGWNEVMASDFTCTVQELEGTSGAILQDMAGWASIATFLKENA